MAKRRKCALFKSVRNFDRWTWKIHCYFECIVYFPVIFYDWGVFVKPLYYNWAVTEDVLIVNMKMLNVTQVANAHDLCTHLFEMSWFRDQTSKPKWNIPSWPASLFLILHGIFTAAYEPQNTSYVWILEMHVQFWLEILFRACYDSCTIKYNKRSLILFTSYKCQIFFFKCRPLSTYKLYF